jgi:hypothetical protein
MQHQDPEPMTQREADIASALNYEPGPVTPGLRLVYSDCHIEPLVRRMARTRSELDQILRAKREANANLLQYSARERELRDLERELHERFEALLSSLAGVR